MQFRLKIFMIAAAILAFDLSWAQTGKMVIETRCLSDSLVRLIRETRTSPTMQRGEVGTLQVKGLLTPQPVVFLGKMKGKEGTDLLFQKVSDESSNPIFRVPQAALKDQEGSGIKSRSWISEPTQQAGPTCFGNAVAQCVLSVDSELRKAWKKPDAKTSSEQRRRLIDQTIEAIHAGPDSFVGQQERVAKYLADKNIHTRNLDSSSRGDSEELWRHLSDGKPAVIGFSADLRAYQKLDQKFEDGWIETVEDRSGRKPYPAKVKLGGGHAVTATGVVDLPGQGRKVMILDSSTNSLELWPWKDVATPREKGVIRYQLVGTRPRSPSVETLTTISRTYDKEAADFVARNLKSQPQLSGNPLTEWMKANEGKTHLAVIGSTSKQKVLAEISIGKDANENFITVTSFDRSGTKLPALKFYPTENDVVIPLDGRLVTRPAPPANLKAIAPAASTQLKVGEKVVFESRSAPWRAPNFVRGQVIENDALNRRLIIRDDEGVRTEWNADSPNRLFKP